MSDFPEESAIDLHSDVYFMQQALREALKAYEGGEVPVGAVIINEGKVIARGFNQVEVLKDATAHAEMLSLTAAQEAVGDWRLTDCDLYVTKEPCPMCAGAIVHCRIRRVIFGCPSPKDGAAGGGFVNLLQQPALNHVCDISHGVLADDCAALLRRFFQAARDKGNDGQHQQGD
ncbi:MAG: tRNA adenosine(34) deaminase TadA [Verrucomicrobiales bacterium]